MVRYNDRPNMTLDVYRGRNTTIQYEVLVNGLGGLSLPRKSVARLTDRFDMILDVYHGYKTTTIPNQTEQWSNIIPASKACLDVRSWCMKDYNCLMSTEF